MNEYLINTTMLNYNDSAIQSLIKTRKWKDLDDYQKIGEIYDCVQNEILFGYNRCDELSATQVLTDGYGQCNTKATLLMALLRGTNIPCRLHGFEVTKDFQQGALPNIVFKMAPDKIIHTWVEVFYENRWIALEGVITDKKYLNAVQRISDETGEYQHYAIATTCISNPEIQWTGTDTYIQKEAISKDLGLFNSPDEFFQEYAQKLTPIKNFFYSKLATRMMTRNINKIRNR